MKIAKTVKLGLSIALVSMFVGCGDTEDDKKDTPNSTNQQENGNSSGDNNSNSGNGSDSEEETGIKPSTTSFIVKMKTFQDSNNENFVYIPTFLNYNDFNYSVDWGDGTSNTELTKGQRHTYSNEGTYTVSISGVYPQISGMCPFSIEQWGDMQWRTMREVLECPSNKVQLNASDIPNLAHVTDMSSLFSDVIINSDISSWDVSTVVNMSAMFAGNEDFNQDISSWDVSNVMDMNSMFHGTDSFNQDISSWDVSNVKTMFSMFNSSKFNQDISSWDVSNVSDMANMFRNNKSFNQDISTWDVSNVESMLVMFSKAKAFNQNLGSWDISKVRRSIGIDDTNLSTINYDKILMGWIDNIDIQNNINLNVGNTKYSKKAQRARFNLIDKYNWKILDGGLAK